MKLSIEINQLNKYVINQLNVFFNDGLLIENNELIKFQQEAINRLEMSFVHIKNHYFRSNNKPYFNHLNSDHYSMYLYILSNIVWEHSKDSRLPTKIFLLNKALHGIDVFYTVKLPKIFLFCHPLGTVLGNAKYSDYFIVYQNCTVGGDSMGKYPKFEQGVLLYSGVSVIGDSLIGTNTIFGAQSSIVSSEVKSDSLVLQKYPNNRILKNKSNVKEKFCSAKFI